ncbi:hypothetical protein LCGC14_0493350 [marine sediment metagenome]|uniref:Uncharacterized protein n=1 Tax=marine sediment metagenome TaxID=412755 RepID=A0A0F9S632_9ZZZZ
MLDKFEDGLDLALGEIVGVLTTPIFISIFVSLRLFPSYFIWIFNLISIGGMISLIREISFRATTYIVGWFVGIFILAYSGLLAPIDILIYLIPLVFLVYKAKKSFTY